MEILHLPQGLLFCNQIQYNNVVEMLKNVLAYTKGLINNS